VSLHFEQVNKVSYLYNRKLVRFCEPLKTHFNINHFYYYRLKDNGDFFTLGSHLPWTDYLTEEKLHLKNPYFCHPDYFQEGMYFHRYSENQSIQEMLNLARKNFNLSPNLQFLQKIEGGLEAFGFASQDLSPQQDVLILQELNLLKYFCRRFKEEFRFLIDREDDFKVDLGKELGEGFYQKKTLLIPSGINRNFFLKDIQSELVNLSNQEIEVYKKLLQGLTANDIGTQLCLSSRTIEHYIENIKNKLNCKSKKDLIHKYHSIAPGLIDVVF
jgi:DNA-binding CsgD family transcriptional regulator